MQSRLSAFIIRIFLNLILPEFKRNYSCSVFNDSGVFFSWSIYLAFNDGITQKKLSELIREDGKVTVIWRWRNIISELNEPSI